MNAAPLLKDLHNYITPQYATQWRMIGTQLGLPTETLDVIEYDNRDKAIACCNAMFKKWLEMDTTASWSNLLTVIESPAVSCSAPDKGDYSFVYMATICWNHVFHHKFPKMVCGWAGHYHYPLYTF